MMAVSLAGGSTAPEAMPPCEAVTPKEAPRDATAVAEEEAAAEHQAAVPDQTDVAATAARRAKLLTLVTELGAAVGLDLHFERDGGKGQFADVAFVRDRTNGRDVAVKFSRGEEDTDLLRYESGNLEIVNAMPGSQEHVIQLLVPYTEFRCADRCAHEDGLACAGLLVTRWRAACFR